MSAARTAKAEAIGYLKEAEEWTADASAMLNGASDRIDALDSIRIARSKLDLAEKVIRDSRGGGR